MEKISFEHIVNMKERQFAIILHRLLFRLSPTVLHA